MDIDLDVFRSLVNAGIINEQYAASVSEEDNKVTLSREGTILLENGEIVARYLEYLATLLDHDKKTDGTGIDIGKLNEIKEGNSPATKLYNWKICTDEIVKLGIEIDSDSRGLIIAGDLDMIADILKKLYNKEDNLGNLGEGMASGNEKGKRPSRKKKVKEGVDILSMDPEKNPNKCDSSLEIILNTLCRNFKMKPKQCAALLTNNNQYLMHSAVKGLKGNFEPVITWYEELYSLSEYFADIICLESKKNKKHNTLIMAMNVVKTGCFSHNYDVAQWCLRFIAKLVYEFEETECTDALYEWFINTTQEGGIKAILYTLKRHSDLIESVVNTFIQFAKDSLVDILRELLRSLYPSPLEYIAIVNDFTHVLAENKEYKDDMVSTGLIDSWLELSVRQADNDGNHSPEERTVAVTFLADLWLLFTDTLFQREDLANQILRVMKRASRDRFRPLRVTGLAQLFRLLDNFSRTKNSYAPSIYKALAMSLVENHADSTTREFIMQNLERVFESQPTIPVGFVVEPLVNQLQMAEGVSYHYNSIDFKFFTIIAGHPKLSAQQAVPLIDILAKIYLNDQAYAQCCSTPLLSLLTRFINDSGVREFLIKFMTVSLSMLLALEKGKSSKKVKIPTTMNMNTKPSGKQTKEEIEITRSLKKTFIVEINRKIQQLRHSFINSQMKNLVLSTNKRNNEIHGKDNVGCLVLLKYWGDPKAMIDTYMAEEAEREKKEKELMEKNNQLMLTDEEGRGNVSAIEGNYNHSSMELVPYEGKDSAADVRMSRDSKRGQLIPWMKKQPKGKIGRKAMLEIEKLAQTRKEREEFEKLQQKQLKMKEEKSKRRLASELEKRKIEYGVNAMNKKNTDRQIIFDEGEVEKFKLKEKKSGLPEIELFDFEEEEQRDVDAIKIFMKKYSKLWRFYFNKYANMCFSGKDIKNFDQLGDKHNTINLAELIKLLKDHDFDKRYMTKEELAAIIRLVNFKKILKNDLTAMNYAGFLEWIIQASIYMFTKPPEDLSHFPPVECLQAFLRKLAKAQKDKGASTILFEDPDATSIGDATLLKALNKKISENPNYPLPEDYRKVKEKELVYDYRIPDYIPISKTKKLCLELLDDLIFEKFDMHFLEPIIGYEEKLKVKPIIRKQFKNENDGRSTPRYLQSLDKRQKPKELNDKGKMSAHEKLRANKQKPVKLGEVLALEVAKFPVKEREKVKEVADILEEILQATEKGYKEMPNRAKYGPLGMKNPVILDKIKSQKEQHQFEKEREEKRKKRDQEIKTQIKKKEETKQKMLEETKDERKRKREQKKQRQKDMRAKKEKDREIRQKEYEEKKKEEMEKLAAKQKEDEDKERQKKEKFEKENKAFLKQQAKKIKKEFNNMIKEKQSIQAAEKEYEEMDNRLKEQMRKKMEKFFEENKDSLKKDKEEKEAINKFLTKKSVSAVFDKYNDVLYYFFEHYAMSEYHELTREIDNCFSTLNYKEFIRLAYELNIIPTILPIQEITYIFNQLVREKNQMIEEQNKLAREQDAKNGVLDRDYPKAQQALDYDQFKKAIVRISCVGQNLLGGQKGPLLEKKMEEITKKDDEKKKLKETIAKKNAVKAPPTKGKGKKDDGDLERDEAKSDNEGDKKSKKKVDKRQGHLMERGAKPPREKITFVNPKEDTLKNATILKGKLDNETLLSKKSHRINKLYEIENKAKVVGNLQNLKVDNTRVTTECDVSLISERTIEALFKHFGLDPQDDRFAMDRKLNAKRLELQNTREKQLKKNELLPEKAEVISNPNDTDEASDAQSDEEGDKSKPKAKKGQDDKKAEKSEEEESDKDSKKGKK